MKRFVIERDIPGVGTLEREQLREARRNRIRSFTSSARTSSGYSPA